MKNSLECPYCPGNAVLKKNKKTIIYRKEEFQVVSFYYKCDSCSEEFTTTETDELAINQLYNQYREAHKIPFPEEIIGLRKRYELSASKMSELLGLGPNSYGNYEKGEMPTLAHGKLIRMVLDPEVFKTFLQDSQSILSPKTYNHVLKRCEELISESSTLSGCPQLNIYKEPIGLTGYRNWDYEKLSNLYIYFVSYCDSVFNDRLKLNKLLFFCDFLYYKLSGFSISGLSYRAIKYGPVPSNYDMIIDTLVNDSVIISNWSNSASGPAVELFTTANTFDDRLFSQIELSVLNIVSSKFKSMSSWDLVELSHKEPGWIDMEASHELINYQEYAFDLSAF